MHTWYECVREIRKLFSEREKMITKIINELIELCKKRKRLVLEALVLGLACAIIIDVSFNHDLREFIVLPKDLMKFIEQYLSIKVQPCWIDCVVGVNILSLVLHELINKAIDVLRGQVRRLCNKPAPDLVEDDYYVYKRTVCWSWVKTILDGCLLLKISVIYQHHCYWKIALQRYGPNIKYVAGIYTIAILIEAFEFLHTNLNVSANVLYYQMHEKASKHNKTWER